MDIKELKGSVSDQDFLESFLTHGNFESLGEVWEKNIECNRCTYREKCHAISDKLMDEYDTNVYCRQVIDYLLGDKTIEQIIAED